jgi:hypothetical protein
LATDHVRNIFPQLPGICAVPVLKGRNKKRNKILPGTGRVCVGLKVRLRPCKKQNSKNEDDGTASIYYPQVQTLVSNTT